MAQSNGRARRFARLAGAGAGIAVALAAVAVAPSWYAWLVPRSFNRAASLGFLRAATVARLATLAVAPVVFTVLGVVLIRARRRGMARPVAARLLALASSVLVGLALAEVAAAAWLARPRAAPVFPERFPPRDGASRSDIVLVVLGESSALGEPYNKWMSMPAIVARGLERVFPGRRVAVRMAAYAGSNLEMMHESLARQATRPDAILVFAGHNEFSTRVAWDRPAPHYRDEIPTGIAARLDRLALGSPLGRLLADATDARSLDRPPPPRVTRDLIDVPACTPAEYRAIREQFRDRLAAIAAYGRRVGAVTIVVVPPSNEAGFEPNRSLLDPATTRADRESFRRRFLDAERAEAADPPRALALYEALRDEQPGFAEVHYRLGRLLARRGDPAAAGREFVLARDLDGMPIRCPSDFQDACREVGARHDCLVVDGPSVLRGFVADGLLDNRLFHDAHHPTFVAYLALARAVLDGLRERRAFGWPEGVDAPAIDPVETAEHFGIGRRAWVEVCQLASWWYGGYAYTRYDPSGRLEKARRLDAAWRRIAAGETAAEDAGIPGLGARPRLDPPAGDFRGTGVANAGQSR